jgi:hypothetical protein
MDDLHVVDRQDRQAVVLAVEVGPRLEVADHRLGLEPADQVEVRPMLPGRPERAAEHVRPQRLAAADAVLLEDHVQAVDAVDPLEALAEEVDRAPRGHDLDLVAGGDQVFEHDPRAHRVAHAFADHAVENSHRRR